MNPAAIQMGSEVNVFLFTGGSRGPAIDTAPASCRENVSAVFKARVPPSEKPASTIRLGGIPSATASVF